MRWSRQSAETNPPHSFGEGTPILSISGRIPLGQGGGGYRERKSQGAAYRYSSFSIGIAIRHPALTASPIAYPLVNTAEERQVILGELTFTSNHKLLGLSSGNTKSQKVISSESICGEGADLS